MCCLFMIPIFPASTVACVTIAAVMFWHVSLVLRFVVATAIFVPAVIVFAVGLMLFEGGTFDSEFVAGITVLFSSVFVSAASVGIFFQLATPWTLAHLRTGDEELPRLGTRTLFELTTVIAITFAFVSALESTVPIEATLAFGAIAGFGALMGICSCMAFLREERVGTVGMLASAFWAFAMSFAFVASIATAEYGWPKYHLSSVRNGSR